jgi:hypothetical protein
MATKKPKNNNLTIAQVKAAAATNPSLAKELMGFLLSENPDPSPVNAENYPLFFNSSKNTSKFELANAPFRSDETNELSYVVELVIHYHRPL